MTHDPKVQALIDAVDEVFETNGVRLTDSPEQLLANFNKNFAPLLKARRALDPKPEAPEMVFTKLTDDETIDTPTFRRMSNDQSEYIRADLVARLVKGGVEGFVDPMNIHETKEGCERFTTFDAIFIAQVEPPK